MSECLIEGKAAAEYLALPPRKRAALLHRLGRRIFGRDPGFRVALRREPPRDPAWVPQLSALLELEPSPHLKLIVVMQLARVQSESAVPSLIRALSSCTTDVQYWAAWGLGALQSRDAVPELAPLLTKNSRLREVASDALVQIGDPAGLYILNDAIQRVGPDGREVLETRIQQLRDRVRA